MTVRCLFGFSGEKPFLLPDNEGVKMNTSPVRMDDLPLNRFHCRIAALTFGAHLTDGYVLGVIGYAIIQLTPAMQLTPFMAGMIGGSALLGLFLGSLVLGWISDHIGRQKIFTFSFMLITLASFLQFFATTPEHLIGLRILIGIGLGGDYSVGHTLLAEFSPRRHRGILLGAFSVVWTVGYVLASIAGHHFISESPEAWRWLLASAALPALLITLLRWGTPESPYCARGVLQKLTLSFIAILARMFYWAMKWQRRPINTSKPCSLRATGGAQRLTASSLSAS